MQIALRNGGGGTGGQSSGTGVGAGGRERVDSKTSPRFQNKPQIPTLAPYSKTSLQIRKTSPQLLGARTDVTLDAVTVPAGAASRSLDFTGQSAGVASRPPAAADSRPGSPLVGVHCPIKGASRSVDYFCSARAP